MYTRCPKCGHAPLPAVQAFPAACPACGVILAKVGQQIQRRTAERSQDDAEEDEGSGLSSLLMAVPERVDASRWWLRAALLLGFAVWGLLLVRLDYRDGAIGSSFIHAPLLVFHEAGHVVFAFLGHWTMVLGGTLGQLLMPLVLAGALLLKNRDPFGASVGLWLVGVSLLDVAPYMYDALHPQLMLLSGATGEEGGHDWIYLFTSMGLLPRAQAIGAAVHKLGALLVLASLAWGAAVLWRQHARIAGDVLHEGPSV
jgi:hypothetical protein